MLNNVGGDALTIQFEDASTGGEITSWSWTVTNDTTGEVVATFEGAGAHQYTFAEATSYTVTMDVEGPGGGGTSNQIKRNRKRWNCNRQL